MRTKPAMETFQTPFELDRMLALFMEKRPERVLEIGSWQGGTLWHWLQTAEVVVSVDDAMRCEADWWRWAAETGAELHLLQGFSQEASIIAEAGEFGPYEFMLVDGDHTYDAVKADWENYRPLMARGGIMLFHDILPRPGYGVDQVWAEIKGEIGAQTVEIVQTSTSDDPRWGGLGCVWL